MKLSSKHPLPPGTLRTRLRARRLRSGFCLAGSADTICEASRRSVAPLAPDSNSGMRCFTAAVRSLGHCTRS